MGVGGSCPKTDQSRLEAGVISIKRPAYLPPFWPWHRSEIRERGCAVGLRVVCTDHIFTISTHKQKSEDVHDIAHRTLDSAERMDLYRVIVGR